MRATHDCFLNLIHLKLEIPLLVTTHSAGDFLAKIKGFLLHTKVTGNGPEVFLKISGGFTLTNVRTQSQTAVMGLRACRMEL